MLFDKYVVNYVERRPRCQAIQLTRLNVDDLAKNLCENGWGIKIINLKDTFTLEVFDHAGKSLFIADVNNNDAIVISPRDFTHLSLIPGDEFKRIWEKDV